MPQANDDTLQGYFDGLDVSSPEPSANRSRSYRHGFANARDDRAGRPRAAFDELVAAAEQAMAADAAQ